jgi:hypothetical protein
MLMSNIVLLTFADQKFELRRELTVSSSLFANKILSYSPMDIVDTDFAQKNFDILNNDRGCGYWLWKPYIILEALKNCQSDEIICYCDSGDLIAEETVNKAKKHLEDNPFFLVGGNFKNSHWTKRDCFVLMDCDEEKYWNAGQTYASISMWSKSDDSISFVEEWLAYCENKNILTDEPNICGKDNLDGFSDHRHDQSVLSNLVIKHNIKTFKEVQSTPWIVE